MESDIKQSFSKLDVHRQEAMLEDLQAIVDERKLEEELNVRLFRAKNGDSLSVDQLKSNMANRKKEWSNG